jgi:alkylation response protein AidB-like acyl-CoA dehydrogenase
MDFKLTEEQLMIQQAARDFAQTELLKEMKSKFFRQNKLKNLENWVF